MLGIWAMMKVTVPCHFDCVFGVVVVREQHSMRTALLAHSEQNAASVSGPCRLLQKGIKALHNITERYSDEARECEGDRESRWSRC